MTEGDPSPPATVRIEGTLHLESTSIDARIKEIEEKLKKGDGKGALAWIPDVLKTLLPSIVLAVLGFALKDSVDQALREREIQLTAVKDMEALVPELQKTDSDRAYALNRAAQLAVYGRYSLPIFVNVLEGSNENNQLGAEFGLQMVAGSDSDAVCSTLRTVIRNHTRLYKWQTHLSALKVLGQAGCTKVCRDVVRFRDTMSSATDYQNWVSSQSVLPTEFDKVSKQASDTFDQLNRLNPSDCR